MSLEGKIGHHGIRGAGLQGVYLDDNLMPVDKGISITFRGLSRIYGELGDEGFKEIAPQMYAIYKEMKKIDSYRKMAEILEDN